MARYRWQKQRGAVAVEFVLISGILFLLLLMTFEIGLILNAQLILSSAAREGGRQASVDGGWSAEVEGLIDELLAIGRLEPNRAEVTVQPHQVVYGRPVRVTINYPYPVRSGLLRGLMASEIPLSAEVVSRSERLDDR